MASTKNGSGRKSRTILGRARLAIAVVLIALGVLVAGPAGASETTTTTEATTTTTTSPALATHDDVQQVHTDLQLLGGLAMFIGTAYFVIQAGRRRT